MAKLAQDVLAETDDDRLYGFLRMFQLRAFPAPLDKLIQFARGTGEDIARAAMTALSHSTDPAIRDLALEVAAIPSCRAVAVKMLTRNREPDDYRLLETFLQDSVDPDVDHEIAFAVLRFVEAHREVRAERLLLLLYENSPCARCRHAAVKHLIAIQRLPPGIAEECRYDCESETRELVASLRPPR